MRFSIILLSLIILFTISCGSSPCSKLKKQEKEYTKQIKYWSDMVLTAQKRGDYKTTLEYGETLNSYAGKLLKVRDMQKVAGCD
jgi:hypothetical protein